LSFGTLKFRVSECFFPFGGRLARPVAGNPQSTGQATESDPTRFVHTERRWAAQRHVDGFVYYIPVVIDDTEEPRLEPANFSKIHFDHLPEGSVTPVFTHKLRQWTEEYRIAGQPRD
jgi:hypothetical protein